jgi:hypothetical protein
MKKGDKVRVTKATDSEARMVLGKTGRIHSEQYTQGMWHVMFDDTSDISFEGLDMYEDELTVIEEA